MSGRIANVASKPQAGDPHRELRRSGTAPGPPGTGNTADRRGVATIMSVRATWNGAVLAESDRTVVVEGNHYFPPESLKKEYVQSSSHTSVCPWKGLASYYTLNVDGKTNTDAAWYYPEPLPEAAQIKNYVAFWYGVEVTR